MIDCNFIEANEYRWRHRSATNHELWHIIMNKNSWSKDLTKTQNCPSGTEAAAKPKTSQIGQHLSQLIWDSSRFISTWVRLNMLQNLRQFIIFKIQLKIIEYSVLTRHTWKTILRGKMSWKLFQMNQFSKPVVWDEKNISSNKMFDSKLSPRARRQLIPRHTKIPDSFVM